MSGRPREAAARAARPRAGRARASGGGRGIPPPAAGVPALLLSARLPPGRDPRLGLSPGPGRPCCRPHSYQPPPRRRPHLRTPDVGPSPRPAVGACLHLRDPPRPPQGRTPHCLHHVASPAVGPSLHTRLPHPHFTDRRPNSGNNSCGNSKLCWSLISRTCYHPFKDPLSKDSPSKTTPFISQVRDEPPVTTPPQRQVFHLSPLPAPQSRSGHPILWTGHSVSRLLCPCCGPDPSLSYHRSA